MRPSLHIFIAKWRKKIVLKDLGCITAWYKWVKESLPRRQIFCSKYYTKISDSCSNVHLIIFTVKKGNRMASFDVVLVSLLLTLYMFSKTFNTLINTYAMRCQIFFCEGVLLSLINSS